jgi:hypothetical protein
MNLHDVANQITYCLGKRFPSSLNPRRETWDSLGRIIKYAGDQEGNTRLISRSGR